MFVISKPIPFKFVASKFVISGRCLQIHYLQVRRFQVHCPTSLLPLACCPPVCRLSCWCTIVIVAVVVCTPLSVKKNWQTCRTRKVVGLYKLAPSQQGRPLDINMATGKGKLLVYKLAHSNKESFRITNWPTSEEMLSVYKLAHSDKESCWTANWSTCKGMLPVYKLAHSDEESCQTIKWPKFHQLLATMTWWWGLCQSYLVTWSQQIFHHYITTFAFCFLLS